MYGSEKAMRLGLKNPETPTGRRLLEAFEAKAVPYDAVASAGRRLTQTNASVPDWSKGEYLH